MTRSPLELICATRGSGMTSTQRLVYIHVVLRSGAGDGACWAEASTLGTDTGFSERTVREALDALVLAGALTVTNRPGRSKLYVVTGTIPPRKEVPGGPEGGSGVVVEVPRKEVPDTPEVGSGVPRKEVPGGPEAASDDQSMISPLISPMIRETKKPKERKAKKGVEATAPTKRPPFHKPLADVWSAGFKHYNNGQIYRFNPKFDPVNVSLIAEAMEITGEPTADHIAEFKAAVNRYFRDRQWPAEPTLHGFCKDLSRRFVDSAPTLPGLPPDTPPAPPKPPPKHSPHVSEDFELFRPVVMPWPKRGPILKE